MLLISTIISKDMNIDTSSLSYTSMTVYVPKICLYALLQVCWYLYMIPIYRLVRCLQAINQCASSSSLPSQLPHTILFNEWTIIQTQNQIHVTCHTLRLRIRCTHINAISLNDEDAKEKKHNTRIKLLFFLFVNV